MRLLSHILLNPNKAERHPFEMMLVGFFYTSLSLWLALWVFPAYASIVMVFFTVLSCLYIVQGALINEESREENVHSEGWILKQHAKLLLFFLFLFVGFLLAFVFWVVVLPNSTTAVLFEVQEDVVNDIQTISNDITGNAIGGSSAFTIILGNNLRVLFISLLFAVFYGAGAIFILVWNASVMGFVIGELARDTFGLVSLPVLFTKFFIHGIPEMLAYFVAALSGGIIFVSILRGDFRTGRIKRTVIDTSVTLGISLALLIIAALLEVYVSPFI